MAQLAIGDDTKTELRRLADEHLPETAFNKPLSYDRFLQIMMDFWKAKKG